MRLKWITLLIVSMFIIIFCCNRQEEIEMEKEIVTVTDTVYVDSLYTMPVYTIVIN